MTKQWNKSDYFKRKAARQAKVEPEWVTNPETGDTFFVRKVSALAYGIAGLLPDNLKSVAAESWSQEGVELSMDESPKTPAQIDDGKRNARLMLRVLVESFVVPKLVAGGLGEDELDPADLDDSNVLFFFQHATGQVGRVALQGGQSMNVDDLKSLRKKPGRRLRAVASGEKLQQTG